MISFHDLVKGDVMFELRMVDDAVMLKSDGLPTYHLRSSWTITGCRSAMPFALTSGCPARPSNLAVSGFRLGAARVCARADVLAADGKKLSKRHGATSISEFRKMGYVPDALLTFWRSWAGRRRGRRTRDLFSPRVGAAVQHGARQQSWRDFFL